MLSYLSWSVAQNLGHAWLRSVRFLYHTQKLSLAMLGLILVFGLMAVSSASVFTSQMLYGDANAIFIRQLVFVCLGIGVFFVVYSIPFALWFRWRWVGYGLGVLLLGLTLLLAPEIKGARRWFYLFGFSIQTAYIGLFGLALVWSGLLSKRFEALSPFKLFFYQAAAIVALPVLLLFLQPNWSLAFVATFSVLGVMFLMGYPWRYTLFLGAAGLLVLLSLLYLTQDYHFQRILGALNPNASPLGINYQAIQSLLALESSGFWGRGLGQGVQKLGYLPEAHNDFILATLTEEVGVLGALSLLILQLAYLGLLFWRLRLRVFSHTFGSAVCTMLLLVLLGSLIIHVLVNLNMAPVIGMSMPFISYGGTFLLFAMASVALCYRHFYESYRTARAVYQPSGGN